MCAECGVTPPDRCFTVGGVGFYAWMLALHLLAAFAIASALVLYSVLVLNGRRLESPEQRQFLFRIAPIGTPLIGGGSVLALILGVILAIDSKRFEIWDGWIIAAIVLWALMGAIGGRTGKYYTDVQKLAEEGGQGAQQEVVARLRAPTGAMLHLATVLVFLLILLDMIFKPGA
jgi:predicted outer membrane lipoprotein